MAFFLLSRSSLKLNESPFTDNDIRLVSGQTLLSLLRVLLSDLLQEVHVHTDDSSLYLLGSTAATSGTNISGTLLVQAAVYGSPVELCGSLLLVPETAILGCSEVEDLRGC